MKIRDTTTITYSNNGYVFMRAGNIELFKNINQNRVKIYNKNYSILIYIPLEEIKMISVLHKTIYHNKF